VTVLRTSMATCRSEGGSFRWARGCRLQMVGFAWGWSGRSRGIREAWGSPICERRPVAQRLRGAMTQLTGDRRR
jgi:hypothetical protein